MSLEMILFDEIAMIANLDSNHDIVIIILMINNSQQAASKSKHHEFSPSIFMLTTKKKGSISSHQFILSIILLDSGSAINLVCNSFFC